MACTITTEYQRRTVDVVILENDHLRVEVLAGKGADITEIRDKRTDVNILFEAPHEWRAPSDGVVGSPDGTFTFLDHYPGGWQNVLPSAGGPSVGHGAPLALHGESSLVPWDVHIVDNDEESVSVELSTTLTRYPFTVSRRLSLEAGSAMLTVDDSVTNHGEVPVHYSWLQHIALGPPLVGPEASLEVPCTTVLTDPEQPATAQLPPGTTFEWPTLELDSDAVDLQSFPEKQDRIQDLAALTDFREGRYTVSNTTLDLNATVRFPADLYEYLWYWRSFGGFVDAPFFGRSYNIGLEPSTSVPNAGLDEAIANGTANEINPNETVQASLTVETDDSSP